MSYPLSQRAALASALSLMAVAALSSAASAQVKPITVSGFTTDDIYNGTAGDSQTGNFDFKNGYDFYTAGANTAATATGLPTNGTVTNGTDTFQLQNFVGNNVLQLSPALTTGGAATGTPFATTGTLTLTTAAKYSSIAILSAAGNGLTPLNVTFNYVGGTTSTTTFTANDWFGTSQFFTAGGRVSLTGATPAYETDGANPGIYESLITPNSTLALQSITFAANTAGNQGQSASIFALSGTASTPEPGSVALAGLGLLGIVVPAISRRRK